MSEAIEKKVEEAKEVVKAENEKPDFVEYDREGKKTEAVEKAKPKEEPEEPRLARRVYSDADAVIVRSDSFLKVAKMCASVAAQKSAAMPMYQFLQVHITGDDVQMKAANGETAIASSIKCQNGNDLDETMYVNCRKVAQIAAALPNGDVSLIPSGYDLAIKAGRSRFKLNGSTDLWADDDFGVFDVKDGEEFGTIKADVLLDAILHVRENMSTDESRKQLNGVVLSWKDNALTVAATDGRCLGMIDVPIDVPSPVEDFNMILSSNTVSELCSILKEMGNGDVNIARTKEMAKFAGGDLVFTTKLVAGSYPQFRQVVPDYRGGNYEKVTANVAEVKNVLAAGALMNDALKLTIGKDESTAKVQGEGDESMTHGIGFSGYERDDVANVSCAITFLNRAVKVLKNEDMTLYVASQGFQPLIITEGEYTFMLMPLKE